MTLKVKAAEKESPAVWVGLSCEGRMSAPGGDALWFAPLARHSIFAPYIWPAALDEIQTVGIAR